METEYQEERRMHTVSEASRLSFPLCFRLNKLIARLRMPSRFGPIVAFSSGMDTGSDVKKGGSDIVEGMRCDSSRSLDLRASTDFRDVSLDAVVGLLRLFSSLGVLGRLGLSCVSFLDAIHLVLLISSRATGSTGTKGCWKATFTQPRQLRPDGMN